MNSNDGAKARYEAPTITSMESTEILAALGPAQGMSSGVNAPVVGGPKGVTGGVAPGSPRRFGRR